MYSTLHKSSPVRLRFREVLGLQIVPARLLKGQIKQLHVEKHKLADAWLCFVDDLCVGPFV
jgi:hypothetical protein